MKKSQLKKAILKELKQLLQEQQNPFTYDWWDPNANEPNYGVWADSGIEIYNWSGFFSTNIVDDCDQIYYAGVNTVSSGGSPLDWAFSDEFIQNLSSVPSDVPLGCIYYSVTDCTICGTNTSNFGGAYNAVEGVVSGICGGGSISTNGCFYNWDMYAAYGQLGATVGEFLEFNANYTGNPDPAYQNSAWIQSPYLEFMSPRIGMNAVSSISANFYANTPDVPDEDIRCEDFAQTIETDGDLSDANINNIVDFCKACLEGTVPVFEEYCRCCDDDDGHSTEEEKGYNCRSGLGGDPTAQKCVPCTPNGPCEFETEQACIDSGCELGCHDMSPADNAWICEACNQGTTPESVQHLCGCCKKGTSTLRGKDVNALQKRAGLK